MLNQYQMDPVGEMGRGVMKATGNMSPEQKAAYAQQNQMMGVAPQQELELMMAQQQQLRDQAERLSRQEGASEVQSSHVALAGRELGWAVPA